METLYQLPEVDAFAGDRISHWTVTEEARVRPARLKRRKRPARGRGRTEPPAITPAPVELSDEALLERLRRGDVAAGEMLVGRYQDPLMRYLQRTAGPRAAEDLHQQTWLSILSHIDRFVATADGGSFRGWLFRIATNKTKDHWRSLSRERSAKEGVRRILDDESPWAGHAADGAEQQEKLRRAIEQLPEGQRDVLMLRYYSNLKFVDIAGILGCPVNTALTRAHKGLIKLRQFMA